MKRHWSEFESRVVALATVLIAFAIAGCGSKNEKAKERLPALPPARVRVQVVENKSRIVTEGVVGTLRAKLRATLEAKLSGRIEQMPVVLGEKVQKGQMIARLDAAEIAARLEQAEAALEQAERDWKRTSSLFEAQSATRADYEAAESRWRIAKGVAAEARAMMSYVEIVAPFGGVVTQKWADVGDLAVPGKPLVDLDDPAALQMEADVPEAIASHIKRDAGMKIHVDGTSGEIEGVVTELAPAADAVSRTFRVKLDLPRGLGLMPGQFARLAVPVGERKSVRVPATAVVTRGQLEIVFAVENQHARLHLVKTGERLGDEVELLSGLDAGSSVVTSSADQLTDGQLVEAQ